MTSPTQPTPMTPTVLLLLAHPLLLPGFGCFFFLVGTITFAERAIPIISSLVKVRRRSFDTQ